MQSVSGLLKIGEAQATLKSVGRRQRGATYSYYLVMFALAIFGAAVGYFIFVFLGRVLAGTAVGSFAWQFDPVFGGGIGATCGILSYPIICKRLTLMRFRKRMVDRGFPRELSLNMEIAPDKLRYGIGEVQHIAEWSAVTELFASRGYWIFLVQMSPWFLPKRFFADHNAEMTFVAEALAHMNEASRLRSPDAVAFAATQ